MFSKFIENWKLFLLQQQTFCSIDRPFPSDGPARRTRHDGRSATFKRVRTRCGAKASGDLEQVS